jgi:hypothetical protein
MTSEGGTMRPGTALKPDGSFIFSTVAPGKYRVNLHYVPNIEDVALTGTTTGVTTAEYASVPVTVTGPDVTGLSVVTAPGASATGRIIFDGGVIPASVSPGSISLAAVPVSASSPMIGGPSRVRNDWTFDANGLFERRRFRIAPLPPGVTDLTGSVQDSRARSATDFIVVAFSPDNARWGYQTRYVRTARPNQDGRFSVKGLPPAEYLVVALDYVEPGEEGDPDQLEKWKALATRVTLSEAESKSQTLKLVR